MQSFHSKKSHPGFLQDINLGYCPLYKSSQDTKGKSSREHECLPSALLITKVWWMPRAQSELGEPLGSTFWHFCFLLQQSLRISWAPRGPTQVGLDCVKVLPAKQRLQATRAPNQNDLHIKQKSLLNKYQKLLKDSVWPHLFFFCSPCCLKLEEKWKYIYTFFFF